MAKSIPVWRSELGRHLRQAREKRGTSRQELADRLGVTPEMIRQYESGQSVPPLDALRVLVPLLNVDFRVDGCRISSETIPPADSQPLAEQMQFEFHQEYTYRRAVVSVTATHRELVLRARVVE